MAGLGTNVGTSFSLRARMSGSVTVGGQTLPVWFFAPAGGGNGQGFMGDRHLPSTHIEPIEGQPISVIFTNQSPMDHTIHLHGLDVDQANDGVPQTSAAVPQFGTFTYQFIAPHAGTYHYHCHVDTIVHYALGMHGAVIVRPPDGSTTRAWDGGPTFDEEVLWQLSTVDSSWAGLQASGPATARFHPDGFLLNGKESAGASADPYTRVVVATGERAYVRVVNAAYQHARITFGGRPFDVVASDGRPMRTVVTTTSWELVPGERYDVMFTSARPDTFQARIDYLDNANDAILGSVETTVQVV